MWPSNNRRKCRGHQPVTTAEAGNRRRKSGCHTSATGKQSYKLATSREKSAHLTSKPPGNVVSSQLLFNPWPPVMVRRPVGNRTSDLLAHDAFSSTQTRTSAVVELEH